MRCKRWLAGTAAALMLAMTVAGCSGKTESKGNEDSASGDAKEGAELVVWSHLTAPEVAELQKVADQWAKETGNQAKIIEDQTGFKEFAAAATAGKGPDLMYGLPHDNLGPFWKAGLLDAVPAGLINDADYEKVTLDAISFDGKKFAVPVSYEAVGLFYNKALVKEAPKSWNEFMTQAQEKGFKYKVKDFYVSYGFLAGSGGYVFKDRGNGNLDPSDVGLASEGAVRGLALLGDFVNKDKLMPNDVDENMAKAEFQAGKIAFFLSGSWDVKGFQDAGIDVGIAPMPTLANGKPFTPFVGVQAAFVNASSKYKDAAWSLIKYLQENASEALLKVGNRIPSQKKYAAAVSANPILSGFAASAKNGQPMPNIPAMGAVWDPAGKMIDLVVMNQATPEQAAKDAVQAVNEAVGPQK